MTIRIYSIDMICVTSKKYRQLVETHRIAAILKQTNWHMDVGRFQTLPRTTQALFGWCKVCGTDLSLSVYDTSELAYLRINVQIAQKIMNWQR